MSETMRDQLRAYLIKTARLTPNAGNAEAKGGKPNEAGKPLFGFLMDAGTKGVQVTADDHHELLADAFIVDRVLGSVGIVHCVDFPDGNEATWEAQVRGWVEDAAHLRHLMAMRMESVRARTGDRGKFLPTVELVFVVNVGDAGAGAGEGASRPMAVLRGQLKDIKAKTELLHAISVNLVQWKPSWREGEEDAAWARGFSWLLLETRAWIASQEAALGTDSDAAPRLKWNRIVASNLRVSGERAWQIAHWGPAGAEMHVVHGPNGSGKSSLAEVFEFALTGKSSRLRTPADLKPLLWRDAQGQSAKEGSAWVTMAPVSDAQKRPNPGSNEPATSPNEDGLGHALRHVAGEAEPVAQPKGKRPRVDGIRGESFRFDQEGSDRLTKGTPESRGSHCWECFFNHANLNAQGRAEQVGILDTHALRLFGTGGIGSDATARAELGQVLWPTGGDATTDWLGLLRGQRVGLPEAWVERVAEAEPELVQRLRAGTAEGLADVQKLLVRGHGLLEGFGDWLSPGFAEELEQLGQFVFQVRVVSTDAYRDAYAHWLGMLARADLLDKASAVAGTLQALDPGFDPGPHLRDVRGLWNADTVQAAFQEAVEQRDAARRALTRLAMGDDSSKGAPSSERPELPPKEGVLRLCEAIRSGLWENPAKPGESILGRERAARVGQLLSEGGVETLDQVHVAGAKGWTQRLVARHREWVEMQDWRRRFAPTDGADGRAWIDGILEALKGLESALRQLKAMDAADAQRLKQEAPQLPKAVMEMVELMTPASWAYPPLTVKLDVAREKESDRRLDLGSRGLELSDVLNTAEANTAGLALFLLCAPRVPNPCRVVLLDDPFQNMDELTVTIVARAMSKWLRVLGQYDRWDGWRVVLLLHGADDCERVVQEVPGSGSVPDQRIEHLGDADSAGGELFDFEKFIGMKPTR